MVSETVLHHSQYVEGRVREILKPLPTPVHCIRGKTEKKEVEED